MLLPQCGSANHSRMHGPPVHPSLIFLLSAAVPIMRVLHACLHVLPDLLRARRKLLLLLSTASLLRGGCRLASPATWPRASLVPVQQGTATQCVRMCLAAKDTPRAGATLEARADRAAQLRCPSGGETSTNTI